MNFLGNDKCKNGNCANNINRIPPFFSSFNHEAVELSSSFIPNKVAISNNSYTKSKSDFHTVTSRFYEEMDYGRGNCKQCGDEFYNHVLKSWGGLCYKCHK